MPEPSLPLIDSIGARLARFKLSETGPCPGFRGSAVPLVDTRVSVGLRTASRCGEQKAVSGESRLSLA